MFKSKDQRIKILIKKETIISRIKLMIKFIKQKKLKFVTLQLDLEFLQLKSHKVAQKSKLIMSHTFQI